MSNGNNSTVTCRPVRRVASSPDSSDAFDPVITNLFPT